MFKIASVLVLTIFWISSSPQYASGLTGPTHNKVVVCYIGTWSVYRPGRGSFTLDDVAPNLCTHLVYAFAGLNATASSIKSLDPWQDLKDNYGKGNFEKATGMKARYPHLKVTLAIGGWNEGSEPYSKMVANPQERQAFVSSVVQFLRKYNFDGLDLDWEYPAKRGGAPQDKQNYAALVRELKTEFKKHNYILTAALGASQETIDGAYDVVQLSKYLDLIHMMCYDYHGAWDGKVGPNAPLHSMNEQDKLSVEFTIEYMLKLGAAPHKLVMGVPFYGRTFIKQAPSVPGVHIGATTQSQGFQGPFTREAGFMGYNEICTEMVNSSSAWSPHWDERSKTPYLVSQDRIIVYDNQRSLAEKVRFAINKKLRGVMVWSIDTDDFHGDCAPETDTYVDYFEDLKALRENPYYKSSLPELDMDKNAEGSNVSQNYYGGASRNAYQIQNGVLTLIVPLRTTANFPLLRTLNEAVILAEQEMFIKDELEKRIKEKERENEISREEATSAAGQLSDFGGKFAFLALSLCYGVFFKAVLN